MHTVEAPYVVERADIGGYEPFMVEGAQVGEYHRLGTEGGAADTLDAGLWRSEPATYDYFFATTLDLRTGDIAYFKAGTRSVWTVTERFKKFVAVPA
jgi:hypothetical protein